jgi:hypothetical protein
MPSTQPTASMDVRFGDPEATAIQWSRAVELLESAEIYWITTVRSDGRPHVTPLIGIWSGNAFHFATGPGEQKARNLLHSDRCVITTGSNLLHSGTDIVIEGCATRLMDEADLEALATAYMDKYGWNFVVRDGAFQHSGFGNRAFVYRITPDKIFGFNRDGQYSQTRWTFA